MTEGKASIKSTLRTSAPLSEAYLIHVPRKKIKTINISSFTLLVQCAISLQWEKNTQSHDCYDNHMILGTCLFALKYPEDWDHIGVTS